MDRPSVVNALTSILVYHLGIEATECVGTARFDVDFGADSLDVVEIIVAVEEEFGFCVDDEFVSSIETFDDAVRYILESVP